MLSVFEDVGNFRIAVTVFTGFGETDFYIVIAVLVHPHGGQTEGTFQFTRGAGVIFGAGTDYSRKIALDLCEDTVILFGIKGYRAMTSPLPLRMICA